MKVMAVGTVGCSVADLCGSNSFPVLESTALMGLFVVVTALVDLFVVVYKNRIVDNTIIRRNGANKTVLLPHYNATPKLLSQSSKCMVVKTC